MRIIGMVHAAALPGAPGFRGDFDETVVAAVEDARTLEAAGFDAVLVENFGDVPFSISVEPVTVAAMTRLVAAVGASVSLPVGVNVLRNDARAALSIAAVTRARFIRVNVLAGTIFTDQGIINGDAAELAKLRRSLEADVAIFADVHVKHGVPPAGYTLEQAARDLCERAGADALIVSGTATGVPTDLDHVHRVRASCPETPVYLGSGVTPESVADALAVADGAIVGTSIKVGEASGAPVDPNRARALVTAAGRA
jgi:membrane complex biogenesis BtpA family protein